MCFFTVRKILPTPKINKYEKFLFIAAHAGDIERAAGGTVAKLIDEGKKVKFLITTDSSSFVKGEPDERIRMEKRQKEQLASAMLLGVKEVEFLPFKDACRYDRDEMRKEIVKVISSFSPDVIFCDDFTTPNEIYSDDIFTTFEVHRAVEIVRNEYLSKEYEANRVNVKAIAYYNATKPNYYVRITGYLDLKLNSVMVHDSLLPQNPQKKIDYLRSYRSLFKAKALKCGLRSAKITAEGFRIVGNGAFHNTPEIN